MLNFTTLYILASTSLLFYMAFGFQSLSSLYSKRFYGIDVRQIPWSFQTGYFVTFLACPSSFRVMAWREIMHKNISLL